MSALKTPLPQQLYRAEHVRELDGLAINSFGLPGISLMEKAGETAWETLKQIWPNIKSIAIVCGAGNNAGDGYVLARCAREEKIDVNVIAIKSPQSLQGDALTAAQQFLDSGNTVCPYTADCFDQADVIVDALLGTGLDRDLSGDFLKVVDAINISGKPVLALDIPSGLNADTGRIMKAAIKAEHTVTFVGLKQGMFTGLAREVCGQIYFSDLGIPVEVYKKVQIDSRRITYESLIGLLPQRKRHAHKGNFGHVLIVGGDYGYAGAVRMSGEAAARTGAGLVSVATRPEHAVVLPASRPELMAHGINVATELNPLSERASVIAIGPGLGQSDWSSLLFARVLDSNLPLVVDADALNLLAKEPLTRENWVLTPHPGEAARLLDCSTNEIEQDRFAAAKALQAKYHGIVVLKGSGTIICDAEGKLSICDAGNPGMASGGMGDVLTGIIAGLLAQGLLASDAALLGVCLHAAAADHAAERGERGMLATDLLTHIRLLSNP